MNNPLLQFDRLPPFSKIKPEHVEPAIDSILAQCRQKLNTLLEETQDYQWDTIIAPIENIDDRFNRIWSPISHLNSVVNSEELRQAYNACLPKISEYTTELRQNLKLYQAYKSIADSENFVNLHTAQKQVIENALRDFRLSGIELAPEKQHRFKIIKQELSKLCSSFSDNVLDATQAWFKHIEDPELIKGIPESALAIAQQTAKQKDLPGWIFNLEFPSYLAVMTYADNRDLRHEMHDAFVTRASDEGPQSGRWDNQENMDDILRLRHELATLLGFKNYAQYSLATKMADDTEQVMSFLNDLAQKSKPLAIKELEEVTEFAKKSHRLTELKPWDFTYYSDKLRQHQYAINQEDLKPYFPEPKVVQGMFDVVDELYGLQISEIRDGIDLWHKDVRFFEIKDNSGELRGQFYLDLFSRPNKRGGAWMDECISRRLTTDGIQIPVAYLTCNFSPSVAGKTSLLTHTEVITLFHEFGHGLHHMLTKVDFLNVAGISGVPWDAVELPSQFMENWCWQREALDVIAHHHQTNDGLPEEMLRKMNDAKNFQSGLQMLRQLEFAIFDFTIHLQYSSAAPIDIQNTLNEVRESVAVLKAPPYNRFQNSFSHIFAGGYAAGYYSYKWAEVLSADAFSRFEETGIFNKKTGSEFLTRILEQGGSRQPMRLFVDFRGREPSIDALLRQCGITHTS